MIRTFGYQSLNGSAQPVLGDLTTAAIAKPVNAQRVVVPVANSAIYQVGDRITLGAGNTAAPFPVILKVNKILSGTSLQCQWEGGNPEGGLAAFPTSSIIALTIPCFGIIFNTAGNANQVYIGTDKTVTNAGLGTAFNSLQASDRWEYIFHNGQNPLNTAELWMAGTAADKIGVAAEIN